MFSAPQQPQLRGGGAVQSLQGAKNKCKIRCVSIPTVEIRPTQKSAAKSVGHKKNLMGGEGDRKDINYGTAFPVLPRDRKLSWPQHTVGWKFAGGGSNLRSLGRESTVLS